MDPKTKIICTLGPTTDDPGVLRELILAGMNVARLNFSHGTHEEHKARADMIKALRKELGIPVAIMIDTKGPDIRVGRFKGNFTELRTGDEFTLTSQPCEGNSAIASVTYNLLPTRLTPGDVVMLDDGLIKLVVEQVSTKEVKCRIESGGVLANNKSLNVPGVKMDIPYIRESDIDDILFAIENDFDFVAASFVRRADDVWQIKRILQQNNAESVRIISKIENSEGIDNIEEILALSDAIMIARGDMGVELDIERIPSVQKHLIKKALRSGKISITATQMLESMIKNPRPTRAETTDVANAIYDGTSAIMLSGETAVGKYPVETVRTMRRIALTTEQDIDYKKRFSLLDRFLADNITDAVGHAACGIAHGLGAKAIMALTNSGLTAHMISRYRPNCPIIACTPDEKVYNQLSLSWAAIPVMLPGMQNSEQLFAAAIKRALDGGHVCPGDKVVLTAGLPMGQSGGTNTLRVVTV